MVMHCSKKLKIFSYDTINTNALIIILLIPKKKNQRWIFPLNQLNSLGPMFTTELRNAQDVHFNMLIKNLEGNPWCTSYHSIIHNMEEQKMKKLWGQTFLMLASWLRQIILNIWNELIWALETHFCCHKHCGCKSNKYYGMSYY